MSVRALLALVIGILLAAAGLALLVWLLWRLWTRGEREKEPPVVEWELESQPAREPSPAQEPERFSPAVEEVPPVLPPPAEPEVVPPALGEPEIEPWTRKVELALTATEVDIAPPPVDVIGEEPAAWAPLPGAADDLKLIEGIGPKIASVLQGAGIETFAHLAATDVDRLQAILREVDPRLLRLADPRTWPEQARLAAVGEWDALTELQGKLKGGRQGG
jgi:predicted flap endonuclease-1-like 5' DNA nuclease